MASDGKPGQSFRKPAEYADALKLALSAADNIELLFGIWKQNVHTVRALNKSFTNGEWPETLVTHFKQCAAKLAKLPSPRTVQAAISSRENPKRYPKIDKSALALSEPRRIRSKEHLRFVARQACLICGRIPSQAHHIRYAQPRGLALKVSDEFTVPLCAIHHTEIHATGDERQWWGDHKIDPLPIAHGLWRESNGSAAEASSLSRQPSGD